MSLRTLILVTLYLSLAAFGSRAFDAPSAFCVFRTNLTADSD
jgi:hypothetical protein